MAVSAHHRMLSTVLLPSLFVVFWHTCAQAQNPTPVTENGRIYVATIYRLKPEGGEEDKTIHSLAIVAIDPATGDWRVITEKDAATMKGGGNDVRLSPDRRALVFWHPGDGIHKCETDGQFPFKIFEHQKHSDIRTAWSGDGKHLVVSKGEYVKKDSKEVWQSETWQIDTDGRNPVKLPIPDTDMVNDWSSDGKWFVTCTSRKSQHGELYLMKTDGSQERRLTHDGLNADARFSPDGKKIVYLHRMRPEGSRICTAEVDGASATELVKEVGLTAPSGAFWSPDGKQIAVVLFDWQLSNGRKLLGPLDNTRNTYIEVMDADGTNRRQIPLKGAKFLFINGLGDWR